MAERDERVRFYIHSEEWDDIKRGKKHVHLIRLCTDPRYLSAAAVRDERVFEIEVSPARLRAPVDPPKRVSEQDTVVSLCERFGYGRVMQIAAEAWAEKDPVGALTVGPCRCYVDEVSEASAMREKEGS